MDWSAPGFGELRPLGSGARGRTVLARRDATGELVVITYVPAALAADAASAERLRREAALLAGLRHPNLAPVGELLELPDGRGAALVVEGAEGPTLGEMLSLRRLLPEAALAVVRGVLLGMAAAHERGVLLRDHRPDNVLVDAAGQCRLINVGIAAPVEEAPPLRGTPAYLAPELWDGHPASPASDVYAAAVTLFECLTGTQPFRGSTSELRSLHRDSPVPLAELPEALRPLLERGMAKAPQERHRDAGAFLAEVDAAGAAAYGPQWLERGVEALGEAADAMSGAPHGSGAPPAGEPWWRRKRRIAAAAAVVVLALLAVALFTRDGSGPKDVVRKPFDEALAALAKSPGVQYLDRHVNFQYYDVTMTATGERFGNIGSSPDTSGRSDQAFVTAGGRDYMSFKNDPVTRGWTYDPGLDEGHTAPALKSYLTPAGLAARLTRALEQEPRLPVVGDEAAASVKVRGTPAWKADTVDGFLYVTQKAPYRVLRWEPPGVESLPRTGSVSATMQLPRSVEARTPLSESRGMDVTPLSDGERLYSTVIKNTKELVDATAGLSVQILQQNGGASGVRCSSSGCSVHVAFSGPVHNVTSPKYALTTVYIELTVGSITTGSIEVGGCTSGRQPYELTGSTLSSTLTCDNPRAGAVYDSVDARNQRKANAAGRSSFWDVASRIELRVHPLSRGDVDRLVATQQRELRAHG